MKSENHYAIWEYVFILVVFFLYLFNTAYLSWTKALATFK